MITSEIISKFELYLDDGSELSPSEELDLANKIYQQICSYRPWEFLKTSCSNSIVNGMISLPVDFAYISSNNQSTNNSEGIEGSLPAKVVFVGSKFAPYQFVNFSDRRQYRNKNGFCYIDPSLNKIVFTVVPSETTAEFDYIKVPAALTLATEPIFPERFQHAIYHGMAVDDNIIQLFDKARGYSAENQNKYNSFLKDMSYWNAMQVMY